MNDVAGTPPLPCGQMSACLPNCPEGYKEARGSYNYAHRDLSCVPANRASSCLPENLQLFWARRSPVVWHWRAEISEKCAISRLRMPIQPMDDDLGEDVNGKALGQFQVVVRPDGEVADSWLIWGPPSIDFNRLKSPTALSRVAADTLRQLRFRPYLFQGHPVEFQTTITIPFKHEQ